MLDTGSQRHKPFPIISFDTASSLAAPCRARGQDSSLLINSELNEFHEQVNKSSICYLHQTGVDMLGICYIQDGRCSLQNVVHNNCISVVNLSSSVI